MLKLKFFLPLILVTFISLFAATQFVHADPTAFLVGDNIVSAKNHTLGLVGNPIDADPGNIIEFRVMAANITPDTVVRNVKVKAQIQSTPTRSLKTTETVSADNANSVSGTETVNLRSGIDQILEYQPNHVIIFSKNCPTGCAGPDTILTSGIDVGDLAYNESAQVFFKANVSNMVLSSPAPTPTPVVTPTPTPVVTPTPAPVVTPSPSTNVQCPSGTTLSKIEGNQITCITTITTVSPVITNTFNPNNQVTINNPSSNPVVLAAASSNVKELPNTGLPLAGLALAGLTPVGLKLKKFGKGVEALTPNYIWEQRAFEKEV